MAEKTLRERREEAEERAHALLRAIVPESEWRYIQTRSDLGRLGNRQATHLEFQSQSGVTCQIHFGSTSENISIVSGPNKGRDLCGGPYQHNDYCTPGAGYRNYPQVDQDLWDRARNLAYRESIQPLTLPKADIWLGQYLALKYDENAFLQAANMF